MRETTMPTANRSSSSGTAATTRMAIACSRMALAGTRTSTGNITDGETVMALAADLLGELAGMPDQLNRALGMIPSDRLRWKPASWDGSPAENFSVLEHVCHLRDIEADGYH